MAADRPEELDNPTRLALERTWLAEERTLLAWVRTATSLITFGFAIYSFFGVPNGAGYRAGHPGPRIFSFSLIFIGLAALLAAALQRRQAGKSIRNLYREAPAFSMAGIVGALVGCLGFLALTLLVLKE